MTHATIPAIVELTTNLDTVNEFFKRMVAKRVITADLRTRGVGTFGTASTETATVPKDVAENSMCNLVRNCMKEQ